MNKYIMARRDSFPLAKERFEYRKARFGLSSFFLKRS